MACKRREIEVVLTGIIAPRFTAAYDPLQLQFSTYASQDQLTLSSADHTLTIGDEIRLTGRNLPTGLDATTTYYVANHLLGTPTFEFQISTEKGGPITPLTSDGSGTLTAVGKTVLRLVDTPQPTTQSFKLTLSHEIKRVYAMRVVGMHQTLEDSAQTDSLLIVNDAALMLNTLRLRNAAGQVRSNESAYDGVLAVFQSKYSHSTIAAPAINTYHVFEGNPGRELLFDLHQQHRIDGPGSTVTLFLKLDVDSA